MSDIITIPLKQLTLWKGNVRKTGVHEGIDELAASIASHGLLQSLVVCEGKRGKYEVVAGQRRYLALAQLANSGSIGKDHPVNCTLADGSIDAGELSLAENVVRMPMHPADQFEAFSRLVDDGAGVADIAARFGVTETVVARRLKLGRLSPVILTAYREAEIGLEQAQAFTVTDDHAAQERVYSNLPDWNRDPDAIRRALTAEEIPTTDKRVLFVGIDAYTDAGGALRQDLFDEDGTGYVLDPQLLDRLVADKLAAERDRLRAEGWHWAKAVIDLDWRDLQKFSRRYPDEVELPKKKQAELDRLRDEYDELIDNDDADQERIEEVERRIDELSALGQVWPPKTLAIAGAIVSLEHDATLRVERGLVREEDDVREADDGDADSGNDNASPSRPALSPRLVQDLTAQKSAAIGAELIQKPDVALAAVVHCLALDSLYASHAAGSCLEVHAGVLHLRSSLASPDACTGLAAIDKESERICDRLPGNPADLWSWCLERTRDELLDVLAIIAAMRVNAVQRKEDRPEAFRLVHATELATALNLDMTAWFTPTAENYFSRVGKAQILEAIDEARGDHAPALDKLKKSELAVRAQDLVAGTGWLPAPLRISAGPSQDGDAIALAAE